MSADYRTTDANQKRIDEAIASYPKTFSLRAYPGKTFRMSPSYSYISDGQVILYTEILLDGQWLSFAKGTIAEMNREVQSTPGICRKCGYGYQVCKCVSPDFPEVQS